MTADNPAAAARAQTKTGETVTIACKLPCGILAEVWDMDPDKAMQVPDGMGGMKTIHPRLRYSAVSERLLIKGNAAARRMERGDDRGIPLSELPSLEQVSDGFGLTFNVNKDWAGLWFSQNKDWPPVRDGMIFQAKNAASAKDQARDHKGIKTGMEPIDPFKPGTDLEPSDDTALGRRAKAA